ASPADDTVRLAFADWLDEHNEPERAEFIRVQIQLGNANHASPQFEQLAAREKDLLDVHEDEWLGPLAPIAKEYAFTAKFRRGFVESARVHGSALDTCADALGEWCPVLTQLDVIGVRNRGARLASAPVLNTVRTLRLEDWPYPDDVKT